MKKVRLQLCHICELCAANGARVTPVLLGYGSDKKHRQCRRQLPYLISVHRVLRRGVREFQPIDSLITKQSGNYRIACSTESRCNCRYSFLYNGPAPHGVGLRPSGHMFKSGLEIRRKAIFRTRDSRVPASESFS